jgi:alkylation response protein AidB-like acyl-CoA dehydrogenase
MDFNDTPEEAAFRARAREFLAQTVKAKGKDKPMAAEMDGKAFIAAARAYQARKAEAGFAGITWAKEQGGQALPPIYSVIFGQEAGRRSGASSSPNRRPAPTSRGSRRARCATATIG